MVDKQRKKTDVRFRRYIKSSSFQRIIAVFITWIILSVAISSEAAPKKYKLEIGDVSQFDIQAPSDIENTVKTRQNAEEKANELEPVVITIENANSEMLNTTYEYFDGLNKLMSDVLASREEMTLEEKIKYYDSKGVYGVLFDIDSESRTMLFTYDGSTKLAQLKDFIIKETLAGLVEKKLMAENLEIERVKSLASISSEFKDPVLNIIAKDALNKILKPNSRIDEEAYKAQKDAFIESYIKENPVIIYKNERIISKDDVVTRDIYEVLKDLNYIDREGKIDYFFYMAVFMIILLLFIFALLFMKNFQRKLYYDKNSVILICVVMLITTLFAWLARRFVPLYSYLLIPVFIGPVLTTIFLGIETAITVNLVLLFSYSLMIGGSQEFVFMSLIGGVFVSFFIVNATQRRKLSLSGVLLGLLNALVIVFYGLIGKKSPETLLIECGFAFINGIFSIVLAIGIMPFLESTFNIVTPLKLLELADPNHPLLKRLLMEAPGTYHHSLMVGNLAEVATREIGGNALLARVGAYFHDVGKLKRPQFYKENQMSDNPHDKLTPNLSTLVITSHTKDGEELAEKYQLPKIIRDIIVQHHGNTLVAYFYHKAFQDGRTEELKEENFRYEGPVPHTREAAIVMLADSVEAAVRSLPDKTPGKIEGLVHKIIKDKLDDGQLDRCDLTLKDLSIIADSFMQVLSGVFHERIEYPELEKSNTLADLDNNIYNQKKLRKNTGREKSNEAYNIQPAKGEGNTQANLKNN